MKTKFVCPYCFDQRKIADLQFRCTNKRCKQFDDIEMTKYEHGNINTPIKGGKTFTQSGRTTSAECPECKKNTYSVVCPSCHNHLPESTLQGEDMIISIVGSRESGKSHFVGVIIKELIDRISVNFDGCMEGFGDSMDRYRKSFERKLYFDCQKLDLTRSSLLDVTNGAYRPLIYKLNFRHKRWLLGDTIDSFTFVFFDTAGEDLEDEDTMSTVNKYICRSSGIIFLLDPMQIPAVRNLLDADTIARASSVDWTKVARSDDIMVRVSNLIRNNNDLPSTQKIDIPVAAVFSKLDAIYPIIPKGCTLLEQSPHCNKKSLFLPDWHNVNSEVQGLLKTWGATSFISQLDVNYTNYSYFAVSALGLDNNPSKDNRIKVPTPHRIEDPLLWLLMKKGVIKVSNK